MFEISVRKRFGCIELLFTVFELAGDCHLDLPAFPILIFFLSGFDKTPIVAIDRESIFLISPETILIIE